MIPHLIHVGYPKTGSTYLQEWFEAHPQVGYTPGGIAGFTNVYELVRSAAERNDSVRCRVTSAEAFVVPHRTIGLPGPIDYARMRDGSLVQSQAAMRDTLAALFPGARVLIVTRGFRSLVSSGYSQFVRTGGVVGFPRFCSWLLDTIENGENPWNFDELIALYRTSFGESATIVLPYELLRDDRAGFLRHLEGHLGLDPHDAAVDRVNESLTEAELRWYPRLSRVVRSAPAPERLRSRAVASYLYRMNDGRFRRSVEGVDRLRRRGARPLEVPAEILAALRGAADGLRSEPLFQPYANDYLWGGHRPG